MGQPYTLLSPTCVRREEDSACIPFDPANSDYREFLAWQAKDAANIPDPVPKAPPTIPTLVSMKQARLALLHFGIYDQVQSTITDPADKIVWDYATSVDRGDPLVAHMAAAFKLSDTQLDELFTLASTL